MIKLKIRNINEHRYFLVDNESHSYETHILFYDIDSLPNIGDIIYMNEKLLKSIENNAVSFGDFNSIYGYDIKTGKEDDILVLETNNKRYYLKRLYG